jgi:hypothetical protein
VRGSESTQVEIEDCSFVTNDGGGEGGAVRGSGNTQTSIARCSFLGNTSGTAGGALRFSGNSIGQVSSCTFTDNVAGSEGGALRLSENTIGQVSACTFTGNDAGIEGGAIALTGESSLFFEDSLAHHNGPVLGSFLHLRSASVATLTRATLTEHAFPAIRLLSTATVEIASSILWHNGVNGGIGNPSLAVVTYADVEGGFAGTGNIDADPLFADPAGNDFRLQIGSPCLEAADPADRPCDRDLGGSPRLLGSKLDGTARLDMGPFEFDHVALAITGSFTPGGQITIDTSGTAGLSVLMMIGTAPGLACHPSFGALFFDLGSPFFFLPWGKIPSHLQLTIPSNVPTPLPVVFQEVALIGPGGNTSNSVEATIR